MTTLSESSALAAVIGHAFPRWAVWTLNGWWYAAGPHPNGTGSRTRRCVAKVVTRGAIQQAYGIHAFGLRFQDRRIADLEAQLAPPQTPG
ncbi:hypothetical protein OG884_11065 [Streptosporangium sp. NBC_01755]|uniref:hypothetical protein n=1 Tax=Streptosporangium sp. NBC_01755 TaxID=2975949 RepID=UPI002DDA2F5A|nr:hypothetical protein [Streptosporangium sp. NBC_01755]WSD02414.1 hypothetical protein OG884_11065 [Streptosporangium sp. NBC_01755]